MAEVGHDTGREIDAREVGAATENSTGRRGDGGTEVLVDVAVVSLEEAEREAILEERQVVVHAAAGGECNAGGVGLVVDDRAFAVGSTEACGAGEAVSEEGEVLHGSANDETA